MGSVGSRYADSGHLSQLLKAGVNRFKKPEGYFNAGVLSEEDKMIDKIPLSRNTLENPGHSMDFKRICERRVS